MRYNKKVLLFLGAIYGASVVGVSSSSTDPCGSNPGTHVLSIKKDGVTLDGVLQEIPTDGTTTLRAVLNKVNELNPCLENRFKSLDFAEYYMNKPLSELLSEAEELQFKLREIEKDICTIQIPNLAGNKVPVTITKRDLESGIVPILKKKVSEQIKDDPRYQGMSIVVDLIRRSDYLDSRSEIAVADLSSITYVTVIPNPEEVMRGYFRQILENALRWINNDPEGKILERVVSKSMEFLDSITEWPEGTASCWSKADPTGRKISYIYGEGIHRVGFVVKFDDGMECMSYDYDRRYSREYAEYCFDRSGKEDVVVKLNVVPCDQIQAHLWLQSP